MQLNSLTLNSNTSSPISKSQLAIYDHKLAVVNTQIFVFGKNILNVSIQTPLHKINLQSLRVEPVFTVTAPFFEDFIMFSFEQNIYLWGKTSLSQINELYQFDGCKFTKIDQNGPVPPLNGPYSFTKFSHQFLLLFGCLNGNQFLNKWYLFDIKNRIWKQIVSTLQIPVCQKSDIIWQNGRGYLLLQSCYDKNRKIFKKNLLYEVKFQSFSKLILQLNQMDMPSSMKDKNIVFTHLICFDGKQLMLMGGQQIFVSQQKQQNVIKLSQFAEKQNIFNKKLQIFDQSKRQKSDQKSQKIIDFENQKIVYKLNLQSFQWDPEYCIVPIKGQNHQLLSFDNRIYTIGGTYMSQLLRQIQFYDFKTKKDNTTFFYEQSLCYYCECAFTYEQRFLYEPAIQQDYEKFCPKNRVENKFFKKFSQSITTQIQAIGQLCQYFVQQTSKKLQINLCQQISLHPKFRTMKSKIQSQKTSILIVKSSNSESPSLQTLNQVFSQQDAESDRLTLQNFNINFSKMKIGCFKLGYGFLYVTSTQQGHIVVSYSSYSQIQFPQSNFRSFSQIFYIIKFNQQSKTIEYSSQNIRNIIFQNVKLHFGRPDDYERVQDLTYNLNSNKKSHFNDLYIIGVTNLQKCFYIELSKSKYLEDIKVKSLSKSNSSNSLRRYLKHLYLQQGLNFKMFLQNEEVNLVNIYEKFLEFANYNQVKQISTNEEISVKKNQNEQTHFSTSHDEIICWKKIQLIDHCKLYEINKKQANQFNNIYDSIFLYHHKKLLRTFKTKKSVICGVIELVGTLQTQLNGVNLANRLDERRLMKWIQQIENTLVDQIYLHTEQV